MSFIINVASLALVFLAFLGCPRRFSYFLIDVANPGPGILLLGILVDFVRS